MQARTTLTLVLLATMLVAVIAWWVVSGSDGPGVRPAVQAPGAATPGGRTPGQLPLPSPVTHDAPVQSMALADVELLVERDEISLAALEADGGLPLRVVDGRGRAVRGARLDVWSRVEDVGLWPPGATPRRGERPPTVQPALASHDVDDEGRCWLGRLTPRSVVVAIHDELGTSGAWIVRALVEELAATRAAFVRLPLAPRVELSGSVAPRDGIPAEGVRVRFLPPIRADWKPRSSGRGLPRRPADVFTNGNGFFSAPCDRGFFGRARAAWGERLSHPAHVSAVAVRCLLRFPGPFVVRGRVVDPDGWPVSGATIAASGKSYTDDEGRFAFDVEQPGRVRLAVWAPPGGELVAAAHPEVLLDADQRVVEIEVPLVKASSLAGRVLLRDGSPAAAIVTARPTQEPGEPLTSSQVEAWSARVRTDEDGRFELTGLHPWRPLTVIASLAEYRDVSLRVDDVPPGRQSLELLFSDELALGQPIAGRVVNARTGVPLGHADVRLGSWTDAGKYLRALGGERDRQARYEPGGVFRFPAQPVGVDYGVVVFVPGYSVAVVGPVVAGDLELLVELVPLGSLRVEVVDDRGQLVSGARVLLRRVADGPGLGRTQVDQFELQTGPDGSVNAPDLARGVWAVLATAAGRASEITRHTVGGDAGLVRARLAPFRERPLVVHVRREDGQPASGVELHLRRLMPQASSLIPRVQTTDDEGDARFDLLSAGIYLVFFPGPGRGALSREIEFSAADAGPIVFDLGAAPR